MHFLFRLLMPAAVLMLAACAAPRVQQGEVVLPRAEITEFSLEARFSVTQEAERHSGRLSWRHGKAGDELQISSPFGQIVAEISITPGRARLTASDKRIFEAADIEQLTREVLGYSLPVGRLAEWVLAREGRFGVSSGIVRDAAGRLMRIDAEAWQLSYEYDREGADALPATVFATRVGGPELRLRIEEWRTP